jgi:hypothetical protein
MNCCYCSTTPTSFPIYGNQFSSSDSYKNPLLGIKYDIEFRGLGTLIKGTEWRELDPSTEGVGFKIMIASGWAVNPTDIFIIKPY